MEKKTFETFHKDLSWSTRIYALMVVVTIVLSALFDAWSHNWVLTIIGAIAIVLFVETFAIYFHNHPKAWRTVRLILFLILLAMLLIGAW
jgi:low affinity Fe/Cu permease